MSSEISLNWTCSSFNPSHRAQADMWSNAFLLLHWWMPKLSSQFNLLFLRGINHLVYCVSQKLSWQKFLSCIMLLCKSWNKFFDRSSTSISLLIRTAIKMKSLQKPCALVWTSEIWSYLSNINLFSLGAFSKICTNNRAHSLSTAIAVSRDVFSGLQNDLQNHKSSTEIWQMG